MIPILSILLLATTSGMRINWTASPEPDLSHYHVYRSEFRGQKALLADNLKTSAYIDATVEPDILYRYHITAVDTSGNESVPSDSKSSYANPAVVIYEEKKEPPADNPKIPLEAIEYFALRMLFSVLGFSQSR